MRNTAFAVALIVTACSSEQPGTGAATDTTTPPAGTTSPTGANTGAVPAETATASRPSSRPPAEKREQIEIEGMREEIVLRLVEPPRGFQPYFYTYAPQDMTSEQVSSDEGTGWRFNARFGGVENPEAFVLVFFYPETTTAESARSTIDGVLRGRTRATEAPGSRRYPWAEQEYLYRGTTRGGQPLVGSVALGRHAGRFFHVVVEYPAEFGDGFGPRAHRILSEWRWADGSALAP